MHTALWIVTGLLVAVFAVGSFTKLFIPRETLAATPGGGWVMDVSGRLVTTLGVVELLGAAGLVLPALLDIAPVLVPLAAIGLSLLMVGATVVHLRRGESWPAVANVTYLALLVFVAWGRLGLEPF